MLMKRQFNKKHQLCKPIPVVLLKTTELITDFHSPLLAPSSVNGNDDIDESMKWNDFCIHSHCSSLSRLCTHFSNSWVCTTKLPFLLLAQTVGLVQPNVAGAGRMDTDEGEEEQKGPNKYAIRYPDSWQNFQQMLCSPLQRCIWWLNVLTRFKWG